MRTINRRIVTAYIVSADGKLLLGRKDPRRSGVYSDCWHNPGGGVDEGESDEQALKREVREEAGIDISDAAIEFVDNKGYGESTRPLKSGEQVLAKMQFNIYKVVLDTPAAEVKLAPSDDLEKFQWFTVDELLKVKLTPPAAELLNRIGTNWLNPEKGEA